MGRLSYVSDFIVRPVCYLKLAPNKINKTRAANTRMTAATVMQSNRKEIAITVKAVTMIANELYTHFFLTNDTFKLSLLMQRPYSLVSICLLLLLLLS